MTMDRDDREYLAAGFALGGLSDADRDLAQQLLETDPAFRRAVAEYEDTVAGVAETDEPLSVSAETTAAILAIPGEGAAGNDAAIGPEAESGDDRGARVMPSESGESGESGDRAEQPVSLEKMRASRRTWRAVAGVAAAAALIAVVGLGGALLHVTEQQQDREDELAQSQQELERTERLLGAPDVRTDTVDMGADGGMTVAWSIEEQVFQVRPHGETQVPEDQVLQLWLIDDAGAHSVGFLTDQPIVVDAQQFDGGALVGVIQEPAGGSEQPTMDPLAVVEL